MAQAMQSISLDSIVNDYLNEAEVSIHRYSKCWHLAFRGMETLGLDFFYEVKSMKLPINPNLTVTLPPDYLNYTKVGVLNSNGEIVGLKFNPKQTLYADLNPNRITKVEYNTLVNYYNVNSHVFYNYWGGNGFTNLYGLPSGGPDIGSFSIDTTAGVILLNPTFSFDYLMLEYVCSPVQGQEYYVPVQFREALIAFIAWKDMNGGSKFHAQLGEKRDRRNEFYNERRLANARFRPVYLDQEYQLNLEAQRITVKI